MSKSGLFMSLRRWQELVVTELAPAHHSRENSHRSLTTHRFTVTLLDRCFLSDMNVVFKIEPKKSETFYRLESWHQSKRSYTP